MEKKYREIMWKKSWYRKYILGTFRKYLPFESYLLNDGGWIYKKDETK